MPSKLPFDRDCNGNDFDDRDFNGKPHDFNRRSFLKLTGTALGIGVLYHAVPAAALVGEGNEVLHQLGKKSGEKVSPFS